MSAFKNLIMKLEDDMLKDGITAAEKQTLRPKGRSRGFTNVDAKDRLFLVNACIRAEKYIMTHLPIGGEIRKKKKEYEDNVQQLILAGIAGEPGVAKARKINQELLTRVTSLFWEHIKRAKELREAPMVEGLDYGTFKQAQRWIMDELRMAPNVRVFQNGNIDFESITLNNYLIMKLELEQQIPEQEKHEEDSNACPQYTTAIDAMEALTVNRNAVTDTETPLDEEDDMTLEVELARLEELKEELIKKAKRARTEKKAQAIAQAVKKEITWKELTPVNVFVPPEEQAQYKAEKAPKAKAKAKPKAKAKANPKIGKAKPKAEAKANSSYTEKQQVNSRNNA